MFSNAAADKGIFDLLGPEGRLLPGHTLRLPLWFRSEVQGPQQLNVLFAYKGGLRLRAHCRNGEG